ncbi:MAG: hypothetical protein AAGA58_19305 [Verrucomicrobiota bacterium]
MIGRSLFTVRVYRFSFMIRTGSKCLFPAAVLLGATAALGSVQNLEPIDKERVPAPNVEKMIENARESSLLETPEATPVDLTEYFRGLRKALRRDEIIDDESRAFALEIIAEAIEFQELTPAMATQALMAAYPEYGEATLDVLADGPAGAQARDLLREMSALDNPYLAAESSYYYGRAMMNEERYEEAIEFFEVSASRGIDGCLHAAEAQYFKGFCLAELLNRDAAADALNEFIDNSPWAPAHLRASAEEIVNTMERVEEGSINDVADHMNYSGRRLDFDDPTEPTQAVQEKIIAMLDDLIEQAEENEFSQGSGGGSSQQEGNQSGQENQQGNQPGSASGNQAGGNPNAQKPPRALRRERGAAKSAWDDLRDREREAEALGALNEKLPPRYRGIVEQYYKDLQAEAGEEDE